MKVTLAGVTAITTDLQVDIGISASTKLVPCVHLHTVVVDWKEEERHKWISCSATQAPHFTRTGNTYNSSGSPSLFIFVSGGLWGAKQGTVASTVGTRLTCNAGQRAVKMTANSQRSHIVTVTVQSCIMVQLWSSLAAWSSHCHGPVLHHGPVRYTVVVQSVLSWSSLVSRSSQNCHGPVHRVIVQCIMSWSSLSSHGPVCHIMV